MALSSDDYSTVTQYIAVYDSTILDNENLSFIIDDCADSLSSDFYGDKYLKAVAYLVMHTVSMASRTADGGGADGFLSEKTIGPVKVKYAEFNFSGKRASSLLTTKYGLMLDELTRSCGPAMSVNHMWRLF